MWGPAKTQQEVISGLYTLNPDTSNSETPSYLRVTRKLNEMAANKTLNPNPQRTYPFLGHAVYKELIIRIPSSPSKGRVYRAQVDPEKLPETEQNHCRTLYPAG